MTKYLEKDKVLRGEKPTIFDLKKNLKLTGCAKDNILFCFFGEIFVK